MRNLRADPRCVVATEDTTDPVVLEGTASIVTERAPLDRMLRLLNTKYSTEYTEEFVDPSANATVRVRSHWAFGLMQDDFSGSPTRWRFG